MQELTPKQYMRISEKHFNFIRNFVFDFCKSEEERNEFFEHFNNYVNNEIEISKIFD